MVCGSNFSYILNDNSSFFATEYKVLLRQTDSCFVKCMKMHHNGKIQLFYLTKSLKPFASMIPYLEADGFMTIVKNLFSDIIDVKQNGFLSCQSIDISFERIYIDPSTYKVSLVYLPLTKKIFDDYSGFENELRTGLVKLISAISALSSNKTLALANDLSNGTLSLEDISYRLKRNISPMPTPKPAPEPTPEPSLYTKSDPIDDSGDSNGLRPAPPIFKPTPPTPNPTPVVPAEEPERTMRITAINAPARCEIEITKSGFVLGKKQGAADGLIRFNDLISRAHCRIEKNSNSFTVTDMQSANGTFVNKTKLQPNRPHPLRDGDILRLANSDFKVSIR